MEMEDVGDLHHVATSCPVLREGVCAILTLIDMEDFEMTMEKYLCPRTCSPERPDKSSWKLTRDSPRIECIWCKGKQVAERQDPLVILGRSLWFRHCKLSVPANWFGPGVGAKVSSFEHKECRREVPAHAGCSP